LELYCERIGAAVSKVDVHVQAASVGIGTDSSKLPHEALSDREFQVLRLIAAGKSVKAIAAELYLSVKTVSTYRSRLLQKMNLETNTELIHHAIQNRLID